MPKTKTNSSVKKRFKQTAGGKVLRRRGPQSHNLGKKSSKRKRSFRKDTPLAKSDYPTLRKMFGRKKALD